MPMRFILVNVPFLIITFSDSIITIPAIGSAVVLFIENVFKFNTTLDAVMVIAELRNEIGAQFILLLIVYVPDWSIRIPSGGIDEIILSV